MCELGLPEGPLHEAAVAADAGEDEGAAARRGARLPPDPPHRLPVLALARTAAEEGLVPLRATHSG